MLMFTRVCGEALDITILLQETLKMFTNTWSRVEIKNKVWLGDLDRILNP